MRHFAAAFLALCFCLLAACAGMEGGRPAVPVQPETPPPETPPVEPEYQLDAATAENTFTAEDGTEVAHYTYTLLTLAVVNGEELPREIAEAVERNVDLFNETMAVLMEKSSETGRIMGEDALSGYTVWDRNSIYYYDETSATSSGFPHREIGQSPSSNNLLYFSWTAPVISVSIIPGRTSYT